MRLLGLGAIVLALASCGRSELEQNGAATLDPKQLVVRLSDLPPRFSLVPGETIPTSLESVLADPWSAGMEAEIGRERVSGFQTSVWNPERRRIQCSVAVYRSVSGARRIFRQGSNRFRAFLAERHSGRPTSVSGLGAEASAFRFDLGRLEGLSVSWRHGRVLATCSSIGSVRIRRGGLMEVVSAQQRRIAIVLG